MDTHLELEKKIAVLKAALEMATEALDICAKPGTYHLVGDIQEQGNYRARKALAEIAEMLVGK